MQVFMYVFTSIIVKFLYKKMRAKCSLKALADSDTILCLLFFDFRIFFSILAKSYAYKVLSGQRRVKGKT